MIEFQVASFSHLDAHVEVRGGAPPVTLSLPVQIEKQFGSGAYRIWNSWGQPLAAALEEEEKDKDGKA